MKFAALFAYPALCLPLCIFGGAGLAQQPPATMTKMEVLLQSPDTPSTSFAAKSKVLYRAGDLYCRTEEQADPEHGIHGLMIIHEPDAWMVNLATKTALHLVDPGPTEHCRMPIFADRLRDMPAEEQKQIGDLEFGCELSFFAGHGAAPHPGPVLQGKKTVMYQLRFGASTLALFTYGDPPVPLAVVWKKGETHEIFWFSGYGEVPFDASLFQKPADVIITEARPDAGSGASK